jgi:hypothetical protein
VSRLRSVLSVAGSSFPMSKRSTTTEIRATGAHVVLRPMAGSGHRGRRTLDDVLRYRVYRDGLLYDSVAAVLTLWENTGLVENQPHTYYLTALYDNGQASLPSNTATAACNMEPGAPTNLTLTAVSSRQMRLQWADPTVNADGTPCLDLAGIRVYREGGQIATVAAGAGQYTDTPPDPQTYYVWEVRGYDEVPNIGRGISARGVVESPWRVVEYEWLDVWNQAD